MNFQLFVHKFEFPAQQYYQTPFINRQKLVRKQTMTKSVPYKVLLNELVSVSYTDQYIGPIDKWTAHTNQYLGQANSMPHRAFSIFLFNSENKLLFQRRSIDKKTFPLCWTNTCCSHPNMVEYENGEKHPEPIRAALHRALDRELKMDLTQEKFFFVDKILYKAFGGPNEQFGEYEVDYVFLCKLNTTGVKYELVKDEISQVEWVARNDLRHFVEKKTKQGCYFSPWFAKMQEHGLLETWWQMVEKGNLVNNDQLSPKVNNYL